LMCVFLSQPALAADTDTDNYQNSLSTDSAASFSAPSGLTASMADSGKISLKWNKSTDADGYFIYYAASSSGDFVRLDDTVETTYSHSFTIGKTYYFKITAYRNEGDATQESDFTNTVKIQCGLAKTNLKESLVQELKS